MTARNAVTEQPVHEAGEKTEKPRRRWWIGLLLLAVSLVLSLAVQIYLGGIEQFQSLDRLQWWAALILAGLILISWSFNGVRTKFLMAFMGIKISWFDSVLVTLASEFAGVASPGSVGMPATYTFLFHNFGIDIGKALGLVTIIVITDIAYFCTFMSFAAILDVFQKKWSEHGFYIVITVGVVIGAGLLLLMLFYFGYRRVFSLVGRIMAKFSWLAHRRWRLARGFVHFLQAVRSLRRMSWLQLAELYGITVGFWTPRYLLLVFIIYLVNQSVPLYYLLLVQGVLNFGGQAFIIPGGGGGVDAGYYAFLKPYMQREALAFTLLVWRTCTFYSLIVVGGPIFFWKVGSAAKKILSSR